MRRYLPVLIAIVCLVAPVIRSQSSEAAPRAPRRPPQYERRPSEDEVKRDRERMKAMNKERAQRIKRDTDKLLELATQLKEYVDKTNENVLSVEVLRKAEEVEKLAKNIQQKMKEDYRPPEGYIRP